MRIRQKRTSLAKRWVWTASMVKFDEDHGDCTGNICKRQTGWWYTYPSEKYEFVSWEGLSHILWKITQPCSKHQQNSNHDYSIDKWCSSWWWADPSGTHRIPPKKCRPSDPYWLCGDNPPSHKHTCVPSTKNIKPINGPICLPCSIDMFNN